MEDELLQDLDDLLRPAVDNAWRIAKNKSVGGDPRHAFLDQFKIEIDKTKIALSEKLYKLDVAAQGGPNIVDELLGTDHYDFPKDVNELPDLDVTDYIREKVDGYEVFDGTRWHLVSKAANMDLKVFEDSNNNNVPAARLWVSDDATQTSIIYVDNNLNTPGYDLALTKIGDEYEQYRNNPFEERDWEDPFLSLAKRGSGIAGRSAGALAMREIGNLTPWLKGDALKDANGWYRNAKGKYNKLSGQRGRGGGGYQKSAQRAAGKAKVFKRTGRIFFGVSVFLSGIDVIDSYVSQDANADEVAVKATLDIVMGAIGAFGGPVGWVISGAYFIFDLSGGFGDFGQRAGMTQFQLDTFHKQRLAPIFQSMERYPTKIEFEVDYLPPPEQEEMERYLEERQTQRDNTVIKIPKTIFSKL